MLWVCSVPLPLHTAQERQSCGVATGMNLPWLQGPSLLYNDTSSRGYTDPERAAANFYCLMAAQCCVHVRHACTLTLCTLYCIPSSLSSRSQFPDSTS